MNIKFRLAAFREIRTSEGVHADLRRRAQAIASACGEGYTAFSSPGRQRARASVVTTSFRSRWDNATRNTLVNNLGAGGD